MPNKAAKHSCLKTDFNLPDLCLRAGTVPIVWKKVNLVQHWWNFTGALKRRVCLYWSDGRRRLFKVWRVSTLWKQEIGNCGKNKYHYAVRLRCKRNASWLQIRAKHHATVVPWHWLLFLETQVRSRGSPRGISGGKYERFSPSSSVFLWVIIPSVFHIYPSTLLEMNSGPLEATVV